MVQRWNLSDVRILNKEGLEFLSDIPDNSIDLILTDPPYITSRKSGMDNWVDHVAKQDSSGSINIMTEDGWNKYKTNEQWKDWFDNGRIPEEKRDKKLQELKNNYLKYYYRN